MDYYQSDPIERKAYVYKPSTPVSTVNNFQAGLSGEDVLPGFILDLSRLT
jgi:hypothetical protein